jgi:hypothetical protein
MLTYIDDKCINVVIAPWQKAYLKILETLQRHSAINDWTLITKEDFGALNLGPNIQRSPNQTSNSVTKILLDPISDFGICITSDPSLFVLRKDEKQWDIWKLSTIALALAQGDEEVLDDTCSPSNKYDFVLTEENNTFMYAVFDKKLHTDQSNAFVHKW